MSPEQIETIIVGCKVYIDIPQKPLGGQQAGMPTHPTVIEHDGLGIKISVCTERSNYKNKEIAINSMMKVLELF
ncbi:MAG: hypothetical protein KDD03_13125 [Gelidibacter sp.]|nr:hypothetical protein [Gelidibacter sp.]